MSVSIHCQQNICATRSIEAQLNAAHNFVINVNSLHHLVIVDCRLLDPVSYPASAGPQYTEDEQGIMNIGSLPNYSGC